MTAPQPTSLPTAHCRPRRPRRPTGWPYRGRHVAGAAAGLGAGEGERRRLSAGDVEEIVRTEVAERLAAARDYAQRGHTDQAERLRREARVLMSAAGLRS